MGSIDDPTSLCKWILDLENGYTSTLDMSTERLWRLMYISFEDGHMMVGLYY